MKESLVPNRVCIFCSSSSGLPEPITRECLKFAQGLAREGISLVYGGTTCGLMRIVAEGHQAAGGKVIGVIPRFFVEKGIGNPRQDETVVVENLQQRKAKMAELSGGFAVLPGGIGTFDEFFDILALKQLGIHGKPIVLLDVDGFFAPLLAMLRHGADSGTIRPENLDLVTAAPTAETAIEAFLPRGK